MNENSKHQYVNATRDWLSIWTTVERAFIGRKKTVQSIEILNLQCKLKSACIHKSSNSLWERSTKRCSMFYKLNAHTKGIHAIGRAELRCVAIWHWSSFFVSRSSPLCFDSVEMIPLLSRGQRFESVYALCQNYNRNRVLSRHKI